MVCSLVWGEAWFQIPYHPKSESPEAPVVTHFGGAKGIGSRDAQPCFHNYKKSYKMSYEMSYTFKIKNKFLEIEHKINLNYKIKVYSVDVLYTLYTYKMSYI